MDAWVYILRGSSGRHYIGSTFDIDRRVGEHRRGYCHTTKRLGGDLELVVKSRCASPAAARTLERRLKRMKNPRAAVEFLQAKSSPD
jgi:putative endonuclease